MKCSKPHGYCFPIPGPCGAMSFLQPTCIHKSLWFSLRIAGNLLLVSLAELLVAEMAAQVTSGLRPRQLSLPGKTLPPSILSCEDNWNTDTGTLETGKPAAVQDIRFKVVEDALALLRGIDKPLAVLSICGPYRSGKSYFISGVLGSRLQAWSQHASLHSRHLDSYNCLRKPRICSCLARYRGYQCCGSL